MWGLKVEKKEIRIETPFTVAGVTLFPISKVTLSYWRRERSFSCSGVKELHSVVVVSPQDRKAFRMDGEKVTLDKLVEEVPGLAEILSGN